MPSEDLNVLRGIEGARVKTIYRDLARQAGIKWAGRRYDRADPEAAERVILEMIGRIKALFESGRMASGSVSLAAPADGSPQGTVAQ